MKLSKNTKIIIAVVMLLFSGYIIYSTFFSSPTVQTLPNPSPDNTAIKDGQDIVELSTKLSTASIDTSIFSSALFISLKDFSLPLPTEIKGRPNPFASIGVDIGAK